jgi:hypothetical protein
LSIFLYIMEMFIYNISNLFYIMAAPTSPTLTSTRDQGKSFSLSHSILDLLFTGIDS